MEPQQEPLGSSGGFSQSPKGRRISPSESDDDDEIQAIGGFCITSGKEIPLVPKSRLSEEFVKGHLEQVKQSQYLYPSIFDKANWYLYSRVTRPSMETLNASDFEMAWKEAMRLYLHYELQNFSQIWPYYYYLLSMILQTKLETLENFKLDSILEAAGNERIWPMEILNRAVDDAKVLVKYALNAVRSLKELYLKRNYQEQGNAGDVNVEA